MQIRKLENLQVWTDLRQMPRHLVEEDEKSRRFEGRIILGEHGSVREGDGFQAIFALAGDVAVLHVDRNDLHRRRQPGYLLLHALRERRREIRIRFAEVGARTGPARPFDLHPEFRMLAEKLASREPAALHVMSAAEYVAVASRDSIAHGFVVRPVCAFRSSD